jgi:hypothetical protein
MITKTDYRKYLEAPMHIWASKHGQIEVGPSLYDQHLMKQGHDVELLVRDFLHGYFCISPKKDIFQIRKILLWGPPLSSVE